MASDGSLKVIADHIRSCAFLIADGVSPQMRDEGMCFGGLYVGR